MTYEEMKKTLWDAAIELRGSVSAAQYKYPVLGLVFLKYVSDMFAAQAGVIKEKLADPNSELFIEDEEIRLESENIFTNDKSFYEQDNVFWIPVEASYSKILEKASLAKLPQIIDAAMVEIEKANPQLKGILYKEFSRLEIEPSKLGDLVNTLAKLKFSRDEHGSKDIFGEVYEYFLGQFALSEGQRAGEFYTPKSLVALNVEILSPFKGKIYDPACGSGGMFVQSAKFKDAHQAQFKQKGDLAIYGQEYMADTRRLCLMNLAVHGLEGDIGSSHGSTFTNDQHKNLRADYVLANPPFSQKKWGVEKLAEDPRWVFGVPPTNNANYGWLQHIWSRLSSRGRAGIILANGSMTSSTSNEDVIRKNMIEADAIDCMISLPPNLFSNVTIPACIWYLSKDKKSGKNGSRDREEQILFIDAKDFAEIQIARNQVAFSDEEILKISQIYHRWRGTDFSDGLAYENIEGFCYSATLEEIKQKGFALTPSRYVGLADNEDEFDFEECFNALKSEFKVQIQEENELNQAIVESLAKVVM